MSHDHHHGTAAVHRPRLAAAFVLVAAFFVVELITALTSGSLALFGDAGHMAADVVGLGAALAATRIAVRPDRTGRRSFGSYRAEVFAAGLSVLLMIGTGLWVVIEAVHRIGGNIEVPSTPMILVGALGLVVNVVCAGLLRAGSSQNLNIKGAYLEVVADAIGSVGVLVAGLLIAVTGQVWWDTLVAVAIAVFIAFRAVVLGREVVSVLGQHAPEGAHPAAVSAALAGVEGVQSVHDVHVWTLTSGMHVATAHLVTGERADSHAVLDTATLLLRDSFDIDHPTLQVEPAAHGDCHGTVW